MAVDAAIAICATFTADPVRESIQYWLDQLHHPARIEFAPYNQVVQTLVDPDGLFARNKSGLNVVLLRFSDWERFRGRASAERYAELIAALKTASSMASSPILVVDCPSSPPLLDYDVESALRALPSIQFLSCARLLELYPAAQDRDPEADRLGHIPYTPEAYAALGTAIARVFHASKKTPYKVVAVDCDNTLWRGICGEGAVELDASSRAVQNFLKARQNEGMLLCVASKNASEDVEQIFDRHPDMPLKRQDFAGWRVNWRPKSENLLSLAAELSLGLDSFLFLDDNPMETAEVEAGCPGVLALPLPSDLSRIPRFLDHIWAFDQTGATAEDRNRTALYRENALRESALSGSFSYADFLAALELEIEIRELNGSKEIERAAQMTQRTNQFNFTTQRVTEPELRRLLAAGSTGMLTVFVRDRYGDYGQVGLMMFEAVDNVLHVRDLLLSCRVLGKGVEHAMVARLGKIAVAQSLSAVEFEFRPTPRNTPARDFLSSLGSERLTAEGAAAVRFRPPEIAPRIESGNAPTQPRVPIDYAWIATHRSDAASILQAIHQSQARRIAAPLAGNPSNETERRLVEIWERALRVSPIGIHDDFFDLGGDSLLAVRILAALNSDLPLAALIEAPTIAKLADVLRGAKPPRKCLVPMKSSGRRPPFYCVHGIGGNVLEFMDLARHVHSDQPFYGIQAMGLAAPGKKFTIEEMARQYIAEIRESQPEGPYHVGGSSLGGLVAYEMARQLTDAGQPVGLVALFDTSVPSAATAPPAIEALKYRFSLHWHNVAALRPRERISYIRSKARRLWDRDRLSEALQSLRGAGEWAAASYIPGEYSGCVTLFRATRQPSWIVSDRTLGWQSLAKGGVEIYDTPGHHADLVRDPRARLLARQLEATLQKVRARSLL